MNQELRKTAKAEKTTRGKATDFADGGKRGEGGGEEGMRGESGKLKEAGVKAEKVKSPSGIND